MTIPGPTITQWRSVRTHSGIGEQARKLQDNDVILLAGVKMGFFEG